MSDITVGGLSAKGANGQIMLTWDKPSDPNYQGLPYLQQNVVEIWAASENDRNAATKIGEQTGQTFYESSLTRAAQRWYWIRCRNNSAQVGEWHPVASDLGVMGQETNNTYLLETNGYMVYPNGLVEQWGQATTDGSGVFTITLPYPYPTAALNFVATVFGLLNGFVRLSAMGVIQIVGAVNDKDGVASPGALIYWRSNGW